VLVNQIVAADLNLLSDGTLRGTRVAFKDGDGSEPEVEGTIFAVDSSSQFRMVVREAVPPVSGLNAGKVVTVFVAITTFSKDNAGVDTSGFSFSVPNDLLVGQQVFEGGDLLDQLIVLVADLLALQEGQAAELHVQDSLGLNVVQGETLD